MSPRLVLSCLVAGAALAAPAAQAAAPIPPLDELLGLAGGGATVQDYCVYEVDEDGRRRTVACAPAGSVPMVISLEGIET